MDVFSQNDRRCYIVREDLIGGLLNGSKHRKYAGLFAYLKSINPSCLLIPGSCGSNHVIASACWAKNLNIPLKVISVRCSDKPEGNEKLLLNLLKPDELLLDPHPFEKAKKLALEISNSFVMPLGGYHPQAALSSLEIGYALSELNPDVLFLDAGTGLTAASTLIALERKGFKNKAFVICMGPLDFKAVLNEVSQFVDLPIPSFEIEVLRPRIAKGYAQKHKTLQAFSHQFFQNTGILLDPVYNAKLFYEASTLMQERSLLGNIAIVHSGGTLSAYAGLTSG